MATQAINPIQVFFEPFRRATESQLRPANPARDAVLALILHAMAGTFLFMLLMIPAVLLNVSSKHFGSIGRDWMAEVLAVLAGLVGSADALLFTVFLVRTLRRVLKAI